MSDIWKGTENWAGWRLTTDHEASKEGQLVLIAPDGTVYGPDDIVSMPDIMSGPTAAVKWGLGKSTLRTYAARGKFLSNEVKRLDRDWIVTRRGMIRVFGLDNQSMAKD